MTLEHPWTLTPAPGVVIEVATGIRWLRMPLPFQLDHINLWILDDGDGVTVVDTGVGLDATRELWERIFATALGGRPITRVILTHFHPDHIGNAAWLTERWPAELWCTPGEYFAAQHAWRSREPGDVERRHEHWRRHGIQDEALAALRKRGNHYPGLVPSMVTRFRGVREGDTMAIGDRRWRVFTVSGHSPEHACFWCPEARVLISGDQVLPKITTNVSVWPEEPRGNPLRLYLHSLRRFEPIAPDTLVLPSHGLPFRGLPARLRALADHHDERLAECAAGLTSRARSPSSSPCSSVASSTPTSSRSPSARRSLTCTSSKPRGARYAPSATTVSFASESGRGGSHERRDGSRRVCWLQPMGRMRQHEMGAQLAHADVIVDDHVAAHGMLGEPGRDLLTPVGAGRAGRGLVQHAAGEPRRFQDLL